MQIPEFNSFPAKVLLFGEYLVIQGGEALAIPIKNFKGKLVLEESFQEMNIAPFIQYLGALPNIFLDQDLIEQIALERLVFDSNIPIGYGAGSSGALTAAVYDAFVLKHEGSLQEALASMEDFFHGSSSGLDPLVSYKQEPTQPIDRDLLKYFYLLDTGRSRKTGPLVEIFKKKTENQSFVQLLDHNKAAISAMNSGELSKLKRALEDISLFQFEYFQEMIPQEFRELWKQTLNDEKLSIKLCGAGGGGFLLLFSESEQYIESWARENKIDLVKIA